jgi:Ni/Co efflux regulator RcnB
MKRAALIGTLIVSLATGSAALAAPGGRGHDDHRDRGHAYQHDGRHDYRPGPSARGGHRPPVRYGYERRYGGEYRYGGEHRYGTYYRPHGYYAHRWARGERLPVGYYARPYWIEDYRVWGLRAPPRGYHWVRVDGDAVLAAVATGIVLDSVFHLFN